jgi:hypothetical protein
MPIQIGRKAKAFIKSARALEMGVSLAWYYRRMKELAFSVSLVWMTQLWVG